MVLVLNFSLKCSAVLSLNLQLFWILCHNLQLGLGAISTPNCYKHILRDHEFPIQFFYYPWLY